MASDVSNCSARYTLTAGELGQLVGVAPRELCEGLGLEPAAPRTLVPPAVVRELLRQRGIAYAPRTVGVVNLRGGIGKTTCTITVASRAAQYGFKTCILDLDAQGSASLAFDKVPEEDEPIFYDVWQKPGELVMDSLKQIDDFFYILPSTLENGLLDVSLLNPAAQKNAVRNVCAALATEGFDLVAIDCPPSLGAAVISTICAADLLVIPLWSDTFSFKGVDLTLQEIRSICQTFNLEVPEVKLLYSRHDKREKLAGRALERLNTEYREFFAPTVIQTSTEFSRALARKETIFATRRSSPAKAAYDKFIREILELDVAQGRKREQKRGIQ
jgi:chromosome partitioning protein